MAKAKKAIKTKKKPVISKKKPILKKVKKTAKKAVIKRKTKKVLAIPKGYHSITPCLTVSNGAKAIEFYKKAFGAKIVMRMDRPDGKISHAELKIGDSKIMLADACLEMGALTPEDLGGSSTAVHLYIKDVDAVVKRAVSLGAKLLKDVEDMFYGDRCGFLVDPYGHKWFVATHVEDVTPAQTRKRAAALSGKK